jgi:hypothetical protein
MAKKHRNAEHGYNECQAKEHTIRLRMAGLWSLVIVGFIYAGVTKDNTLPKELLTIATTAAGGIKALKCYEERGNNKS